MGSARHDLGSHAAKVQAIGKILPQVKYLALDAREDVVAQIATRAGVGNLPNDLMMTTRQLQALHAAGMEIGGHTHRHPILAKLGREHARDEIAAGKAWLEDTLGAPVRVFAYPNGKPGADYLPEQADVVRELGIRGGRLHAARRLELPKRRVSVATLHALGCQPDSLCIAPAAKPEGELRRRYTSTSTGAGCPRNAVGLAVRP